MTPTALAWRRARDLEPVVVVPVVVSFLLRLAERHFMGCCSRSRRARTGGSPGFTRRIEPSAPEDRMAQAPRIGVRSMSDPCPNVRVNPLAVDVPARHGHAARSRFRKRRTGLRATGAGRQQYHEAQEAGGLARRHDHVLRGCRRNRRPAMYRSIRCRQPSRTVGRRGTARNRPRSAHKARAKPRSRNGRAVEIYVGEKLTPEVADGQATVAGERREKSSPG